MPLVDIILLVILLLGAWSGYRKGLILEIVAIVAFILAVIGGFKLLDTGMGIISSFYDGLGKMLPVVAFLLIFVLIVVVVNLVGKILKKVINWTPLGFLDNIAGAVLGAFKWALAISILFWIGSSAGMELPASAVEKATIYPVVVEVAPKTGAWIGSVFPPFGELMDTVSELFKKVKG